MHANENSISNEHTENSKANDSLSKVAPIVLPSNKRFKKCNICGKKFMYTEDLLNHHTKCHTEKWNLQKCAACHKRFTTLYELNRHISKIHNGEEPKLICQLCGFETKNKTFSDNHMDIIHLKKNLEDILLHNSPFDDCPLCPSTYNSKTDLNLHLSSVHGLDIQSDISIGEPQESMLLPKTTSISTMENDKKCDVSIDVNFTEYEGEMICL